MGELAVSKQPAGRPDPLDYLDPGRLTVGEKLEVKQVVTRSRQFMCFMRAQHSCQYVRHMQALVRDCNKVWAGDKCIMLQAWRNAASIPTRTSSRGRYLHTWCWYDVMAGLPAHLSKHAGIRHIIIATATLGLLVCQCGSIAGRGVACLAITQRENTRLIGCTARHRRTAAQKMGWVVGWVGAALCYIQPAPSQNGSHLHHQSLYLTNISIK